VIAGQSTNKNPLNTVSSIGCRTREGGAVTGEGINEKGSTGFDTGGGIPIVNETDGLVTSLAIS
jgi:hypothetical protein